MEETNDEDIYRRRKIMKKIKEMAVVVAMTVFCADAMIQGRTSH